MPLPLPALYSKGAAKYLQALDATTKKRIKEKIAAIASSPADVNISYPLTGSGKRSARVGDFRILILVKPEVLLVTEIGSRGQIYRTLG